MRTATVFNFLVEAELIGSAVMVGVMLVRALLRRPLGSRFVRALWLLVALRLLLPIALPNPLMNALKPTLSLDAGIRPMADQVRTRVGDAATALYWKTVAHQSSPTLRQALMRLARAAGNGRLSWLVMLVYLTGALGVAGWTFWANLRFRRRWALTAPSDEARALWEKISQEAKLKKAPALFEAEGLPSVCVSGCFRLRVLMPAGAPQETLEAMLRHAVAHARLGTGIWALVRDICLCAHWFNPLTWACAYLSRLDDALACDELAATDSERYAGWLIHQQNTLLASPALPVAASCVTMSARVQTLRIRQVLHPGQVQPVALGAVCLAAALTMSIMFATGEQSSREYIPMLLSPPLVTGETHLTTSEEAEAFARRFIALEGIAAGEPSEYALVTQTEEGWQVSLYMSSGEACEIAFDQQGTLLEYIDTNVDVDMLRPLAEPITAETAEGRAWCAFVASFLERHVPAVYQAFEAMEIAGSGRIDGDEFLTVHLLDEDGKLLHVVQIQAAPEGRIYGFWRGERAAD